MAMKTFLVCDMHSAGVALDHTFAQEQLTQIFKCYTADYHGYYLLKRTPETELISGTA